MPCTLTVVSSISIRISTSPSPAAAIWRTTVIRLLRSSYARIMPGILPGLGHIRDERQWRRYLQAQYDR